ncbi:mechanosensitive ion channel protein 10 isoform X2 [Jatropha curcas]|uniref:mechanosensitive ion channel protein 10 isoform X2 n=1 Tax=Jatropha curcas TaxID=180498 RepID=UPI0009D68655|nr:mechanosensitive ion channel protein 10 isoform X2 [Jatropha curcas]
MDNPEKGRKGGNISMLEKKSTNGGEVLITISNEEKPNANATPKGLTSPKDQEILGSRQSRPNSPVQESNAFGFIKSMPISYPSPEISRFSPSPNKPPKVPASNENFTRRRSLTRSVYSKPKSRFGEQPYPIDDAMFEEDSLTLQEQFSRNSPYRNSLSRGSPNNKSASTIRTNSITPKTPLMASPGGPADDEDELDEVVKKVELSQEKHKRIRVKLVIQWVAFVCIVGCLVAGLTVEKLEKTMIWGLDFWKWSVLVMVTFSGMSITNWFMHFIVFLIERNFLLRKKVLYFVYGLKKSVQVFMWIGLVLLAWAFLFNRGVERSKTATKILNYVTWTLISLLIGSFLWLLKTLLLKILASNFHVTKFFDRIQESVFHQYVLQTLSGPPLIEEAERVGRSASTGQLSFRSTKKGKETKEKKVIDMGMLHKIKQEKVSAWTMKVLVDAITNSGLSTISNTLDESIGGAGEQTDSEITNEMEATAAAYHIFRNVAKPGWKYIDEEDLLRFMIKEEVDLVFPLFEVSETRQIERKALTDWVVKVYKGRKALAHALSDTKTAVKQLNKLVTLVVAAFIFGNTCKTMFEAIIFVFVMHPFDVGDRCVVDGVPLLVEEMNILTTVFLKLDNEKIYYPNSVLATKPISNYYRSPDMGDSVEFSIDFSTPTEKIGLLKDKIKKFLEKNPQHWHPNHSVVVKEIENVNKLKMALYCSHTMNFQEFGEKNKRRTELVLEIKKIFEELNIRYYLLPQQVHLSHIGSESTIVTGR